MIWNIITDSSCDLQEMQMVAGDHMVRYRTVPFVISIGGKDYIDDAGIALDRMIDGMEQERSTSSACPSPGAWLDAFSEEGCVIAITISGRLSGSFDSACTARDLLLQEEPEKKITVIDSVSAGAGLVMMVKKICTYIGEGMSFEEVAGIIRETAVQKRTIFALSSFQNLVRNGRMSPFVGFAAKRLSFWGIGVGSREGEIRIKGKVRGAGRMIRFIIEDIREQNRPLHCVYISHCQNLQMAQQLKEEVLRHWENVLVEIHETRGLCSYYAERHGLIVSYL